MARRISVGDDIRVKETGAVLRVSEDNGTAYKAGGKWLHQDDVETILRVLNNRFTVSSYDGGVDGDSGGIDAALKPGLRPFHCSGKGVGHTVELLLAADAPSVLLTHLAIHGAPGCGEQVKSGRIWLGESSATLSAEPSLAYETNETTKEWTAALGRPTPVRVVRVSFDTTHGEGDNVDVGLIALVGLSHEDPEAGPTTLLEAIPAPLQVTGLKKIKKRKNWMPLESNPKVVSKYIRKLGFDPSCSIHEILSLEEWALDMVPKPVRAVLLLFPIGKETEVSREAGLAAAAAEPPLEGVVHMKQLVGNACGTIALLHVMANLCKHSAEKADPGSWLDRFLDAYQPGMTSDDLGKMLEEDKAIEAAHREAEEESEARNHSHANRNLHFIAFAEIRGKVVELDGRNDRPIERADVASLGGDFLSAACAVIRSNYMEVSPDALRFNMMAVCGEPSSAAAPPAGGAAQAISEAISEADVAQLVTFGFDSDTARNALVAAGGNVETAANFLLG